MVLINWKFWKCEWKFYEISQNYFKIEVIIFCISLLPFTELIEKKKNYKCLKRFISKNGRQFRSQLIATANIKGVISCSIEMQI